MSSILPSNRTVFEEAVESSFSPLLPNLIASIWNPDTCPEQFLKYMAWGLAVDFWDDNWLEADRRNVLRNMLFVHQHKGTVAAVKRAVEKSGLGSPIISENSFLPLKHNGTFLRDGSHQRNGRATHWAYYEITIASVLTALQAAAVKKIVSAAAPARSHLIRINFSNGVKHDGIYSRDGTVSRGSVFV